MSESPTNIRAHQADQVLELVWNETETVRLPYDFLRSQCPCASCRDEWTGKRLLDPATIRPDLKLEGMQTIGNYAVQFSWNDGHGSGLFTWELLRNLSNQVARPDSATWRGIDPPPKAS